MSGGPDRPGGLLVSAALLLVLGAVALFWTPIFHGGLILDDHLFLEQDARLSDPSIRGRIWTTSLFDLESLGRPWASPGSLPSYYRPMVLLSLFTAQDLLGPSTVHHHLFNVLGHGLLAVLILFWLARAGSPRTGLVVSLLFLTHPASPEVVGWLAGRSDLLAVLMGLVALYLLGLDPAGEGTGARDLLAGLVYLGACLSKETAALMGPLFPLATYWREGKPGRGMRVFLPVWAIYLAMRFHALGTLFPSTGRSLDLDPVKLASWTWRWLQHLFVPHDLRLLFYPAGHGTWDPGWADGLTGLLLLGLAVTWLTALRSPEDRPELVTTRCLGALLIVLPLFPVLGWFPIPFPFSDRYVYASAAGVSLLLGGILGALPGRLRRFTWGGLLVACLVFGATLVERNEAFRSPERFLEVALAGSGQQSRAYHFLGEELLRQGRAEEAGAVLERALVHHPRSGTLLLAYGVSLRRQGRPEEALAVFDRVPEEDLNYPTSLCHQAYALRVLGRLGEARQRLEEGLARFPRHAGMLDLRGEMHLVEGDLVAARQDLEAALEGQPLEPLTHFNLGLVLHRQGELAAAIEEVHRAHRLRRDDPRLAGALGQLLAESGQVAEARTWLALARRLEQAGEGGRSEGRRAGGMGAPGMAAGP